MPFCLLTGTVLQLDVNDTKDGWCRGLLIYVRVGIVAARFDFKLTENMNECEGVTLPYGNKTLTVVLAYRPPRPPGSDADNGFSDKLCDLLTSITAPAVLVGDMNYPGID